MKEALGFIHRIGLGLWSNVQKLAGSAIAAPATVSEPALSTIGGAVGIAGAVWRTMGIKFAARRRSSAIAIF